MRIRGLVQGVMFRESMRHEATRLQVNGWVRNRSDGSVEAFVTGEDTPLRKIIEWCHRGPPRANVDSVSVQDYSEDAEVFDFSRRETV